MKWIFWILTLSLLSFTFTKTFPIKAALAQENDDEFFDDEEPMIDPADQFVPPSPDTFGNSSPNGKGGPRSTNNRFNTPGGMPTPNYDPGYQGAGSGAGRGTGLGTTPDGAVQFRLVDPPVFKRPKMPLRIPLSIRKKVEARLKKEDQKE